jgi:hypothetical protein
LADARLTVTSAGNVGIGTTSPTAELHVSGSNTDSLLLIASPGAASALFVSGSGFVGIGTTTPTYPLTIGGTNPAMLLSTSTGQSTLYFTNTSNAIYNLSSDNGLVFYVNSSNQGKITTNGNWGIGTTSPTEKLHVSGGNVLIVNSAAANDANTTVLRLQAGSDATLGALYLQTELRPSATGGNRRVEIYAGDNSAYRNITFPYASVGIGTTSPSYKLHVVGSNNTTPFGISVGSNAHYVFTGNSTSGYTTTFNINDTGLYIGHNSSARSLSLQTNSTDRLTILGGGNVGIGTTAPDSNLQVGSVSTAGNRTIRITDSGYGLLLSGGGGSTSNYIQSLGTTIPLYFLAGNNNDANYIFSSTGNVGIGTTTPARKLDVVGLAQFSGQVNFNATGAQIQLGGQGTGTQTGIYQGTNSDILYIGNWANSTNTVAINASSGNVGIGTASPAYKLDVNGTIRSYNNTNGDQLIISSNTDSGASAQAIFRADNGTYLAQFGVRGTSAATFGALLSSEAYLYSSVNAANSGIVLMANAANGVIKFATGGTTETVRISATGNVGIGTTSPNARLDVSGNAIITGSLAIGTSSLGSTENTLVVGPPPAGGTGEGGQILLQASGASYPSASMIDTYQNRFRILRGSNASSDSEHFSINLHSGQLTLNKYTAASSFSGTATANLAVDSSGNVITVATGGGGGSAPTAVTFTRVTGSYTFALADAGKTVELSASAAGTYNLTVPPASTTNFADGTFIDVILYGTGSIQFVTGSGVTFRSANNWTKLGTRYGAATIINIAGDEWYLIGNLNA